MTNASIDKHKKLYTKAKKLTDTIHRHHRQAYDSAIDSHLTGKDGLVDMDKLDNSKVQDKFVDKMTDIYLSKAKQTLGMKGKDQIENELILNTYAGITKNELKSAVKSQGSDYTFDNHHGHMKQIIKEKIAPTLFNAASSHLKSSDISDIIKYTKTSGFIDSKKIRKGEAINLLTSYHESGQVASKPYRHEIYYKKPKK